MFRTRENISFVNFDAILVVLVLFCGLMICANYSGNKIESLKKPVSSLTAATEHYAISTPLSRLQIFQKTWISNKDNFNLLAFNRNQLSENRKTNIRVSQLQLIRLSLSIVPQFIFRYHLFPGETEEPPSLS
jgi:hypothetical protein